MSGCELATSLASSSSMISTSFVGEDGGSTSLGRASSSTRSTACMTIFLISSSLRRSRMNTLQQRFSICHSLQSRATYRQRLSKALVRRKDGFSVVAPISLQAVSDCEETKSAATSEPVDAHVQERGGRCPTDYEHTVRAKDTDMCTCWALLNRWTSSRKSIVRLPHEAH